jgi:predicted acetyltransferase
MIAFADSETTTAVREMWKTCFAEDNAYLDLYFGRRYRQENTLIGLQNGTAAASLQMLPLKINAWGSCVNCSYLAGICTLPEHRKSGLMRELLSFAFNESLKRGDILTSLIPQHQWLFDVYAKFGFSPSFVAHRVRLQRNELEKLGSAASQPADISDCKVSDVYTMRNALFSGQNLYGLLSETDFRFAVDESLLFGGHLLSVGNDGWALVMRDADVYIREMCAKERHVPALAKRLLKIYPDAGSFSFTMPSVCAAFGGLGLETPLGMARILDVEAFAGLIAKANPALSLEFEVKDEIIEKNNGFFEISGGEVKRAYKTSKNSFSIAQATGFLMGSSDIFTKLGITKDNRRKIKPYLNLLLN